MEKINENNNREKNGKEIKDHFTKKAVALSSF